MIAKYTDKICELCGKPFTPKSGVAKYCKSPVSRTCIICGSIFTSICHPKASTVCNNSNCKNQVGVAAASKSVHRICRVCGKPFDANSCRQLDCGKEIIKICEICGNPYKSRCGFRWQGHTCDNPKCKTEYIHKTQQAHYLATTRTCAWCGKEFHPTNNKQILCGEPHTQTCMICGKEFTVDAGYSKETAPKCCSEECVHKAYQIPHPLSKETIDKMIATKIERYGEDYAKAIWAKGRKTYAERTGYSHPIYNIKTHYKRAETRSKIEANDGRKFDSNYECQVYNFLLNIDNIHIETQVPIKYQYNNVEHQTWVDFKVDNKLIEVKGGHLLLGVYDTVGIPICTKLAAYNEYSVIVITNNGKNIKDILNKYNLVGIDIALFDNTLSKPKKLDRWAKIQQALIQGTKFIEESTLY